MKITRRLVFVGISLIAIVVAATILGLRVYMMPFDMSDVFQPHTMPFTRVDMWGRLTTGMTKSEVSALLGDAPWKIVAEAGDQIWEYGHTLGFSPVESPEAYVVRFDKSGRVVSFRAPLRNQCEKPNKSPEPTPGSVTPRAPSPTSK
jgi:outer membrane protein assembly factor BamE (lipoprotein component of BamABCDE complex)